MENALINILNSQPFIIAILVVLNVVQYRDKKELEKNMNNIAVNTVTLMSKLEMMFTNVINNDMSSQQLIKELITEIKRHNNDLKKYIVDKLEDLK